MRSLLTAVFLAALVCVARAGVLVELTDGTKLTVESHWNDGADVHLVRGGVDMIVPKSRIKSMDEAAADPDVYRGTNTPEAAETDGDVPAPAPASGGASDQPAAADPSFSEMSADELKALHEEESARLLEAQDDRFNAIHGGAANQAERKAAEDAFYKQIRRTAQVWGAFEQAKQAESGVPSVPRVEQPLGEPPGRQW